MDDHAVRVLARLGRLRDCDRRGRDDSSLEDLLDFSAERNGEDSAGHSPAIFALLSFDDRVRAILSNHFAAVAEDPTVRGLATAPAVAAAAAVPPVDLTLVISSAVFPLVLLAGIILALVVFTIDPASERCPPRHRLCFLSASRFLNGNPLVRLSAPVRLLVFPSFLNMRSRRPPMPRVMCSMLRSKRRVLESEAL